MLKPGRRLHFADKTLKKFVAFGSFVLDHDVEWSAQFLSDFHAHTFEVFFG